MRVAVFSEQLYAGDAAVFNQQVESKLEFGDDDILDGFCFEVESASDFLARGVAMRMQNAIATVSAFAGKGQLGSIAIKVSSPRDQLFDPFRTLFYEYASSLGIT